MTHRDGVARTRRCVGACAVSVVFFVSASLRADELSARPPPLAACLAWRDHISELIDQHRVAGDLLDDDLWAVVQQFTSARDTCTSGDITAGLRIYERIDLGRVHGLLR